MNIEPSLKAKLQRTQGGILTQNSQNGFEKSGYPQIEVIDSEEGKETEGGVFCGEELFVEICENAIKHWIEMHNDEIMDRVVNNYNLQPKTKKQKVTEKNPKKV